MFDDTSPFDGAKSAAPHFQRARGRARCDFKQRDGHTVLETLGQSGSFKVRLPKKPAGEIPEAVLLNTAGGLTGGDVLDFSGRVAPGGHAVFTTQASERAYRALSGSARVTSMLEAGTGARIDWLPQETILFDGAALSRTFDVDLADGAELLAHESVVFGRTAMGETVRRGLFSDRWRVRRNGRLIHADAVRVGGDIAATLARPATLNDARAMATIVLIAADAESRADPLRDELETHTHDGALAGVSAWDGKLVFRAVACDGRALRRTVEPILKILTDGRGLPRVWSI